MKKGQTVVLYNDPWKRDRKIGTGKLRHKIGDVKQGDQVGEIWQVVLNNHLNSSYKRLVRAVIVMETSSSADLATSPLTPLLGKERGRK